MICGHYFIIPPYSSMKWRLFLFPFDRWENGNSESSHSYSVQEQWPEMTFDSRPSFITTHILMGHPLVAGQYSPTAFTMKHIFQSLGSAGTWGTQVDGYYVGLGPINDCWWDKRDYVKEEYQPLRLMWRKGEMNGTGTFGRPKIWEAKQSKTKQASTEDKECGDCERKWRNLFLKPWERRKTEKTKWQARYHCSWEVTPATSPRNLLSLGGFSAWMWC